MALWVVEAKPGAFERLREHILCKWHQQERGWRALVSGVSEEEADRLQSGGQVARIQPACDGWYPDSRGGAYLVRDGLWYYVGRMDIKAPSLNSRMEMSDIARLLYKSIETNDHTDHHWYEAALTASVQRQVSANVVIWEAVRELLGYVRTND